MNRWLDSTVVAYRKYFPEPCHRPVVWDVGSRDGEDGEELARRIWVPEFAKSEFWSQATVCLVEANPAQASIIRASYPQAVVHEVAVSDRAGWSTFTQMSGEDKGWVGTSKLGVSHDYDETRGDMRLIDVRVVRLDSLIPAKMGVIDIMKIDVEGWAYEALQGLGERLRDIKVLHVETEHPDMSQWHHEGHKNNVEVAAFMRGQGFELFMVEYEYGGIQDQVWVNASLASQKSV